MEELPIARERPILFSPDMVNAILTGRKTVTRRLFKPQPFPDTRRPEESRCYAVKTRKGIYPPDFPAGYEPGFLYEHEMGEFLFHEMYGNGYGPYGSVYHCGVSDRLWVREGFRITYFDNGQILIPELEYRADGRRVWCEQLNEMHNAGTIGAVDKWRPGIFMPRWASRILLELGSVDVARLQSIRDLEILTEGISAPIGADLREVFATRWNAMHPNNPWSSNPWVWVLGFKQVDA